MENKEYNIFIILFKTLLAGLLATFLTGCAQYRCNDGTYVEDPYLCFNHGGIGYYSTSMFRTKTKSSKILTGTWNVNGDLKSNSCPTLNNKISTPVRITQLSNGVISIRSLAGYGSATTKLRKNRALFSVRRNSILFNLQGIVNVSFASNNNSATLSATGTAQFLGGKTCDLSLRSTAKKR